MSLGSNTPPDLKRCWDCKQSKPFNSFYSSRTRGSKVYPICKACSAERQRLWAKTERGREMVKQGQFRRRLKRHGLSPESYGAMLAAQGGVCAICKVPERTGADGHLFIDHDHETGVVRGLLCGQCNAGIGLLLDDPEVLMAAADYITSSNTELRVSA